MVYVVLAFIGNLVGSISDKFSPVNLSNAVYSNAAKINSLSPQDREKYLTKVRSIVKAYKPFVDEVWPLLENCPLVGAQEGKSKKGKNRQDIQKTNED